MDKKIVRSLRLDNYEKKWEIDRTIDRSKRLTKSKWTPVIYCEFLYFLQSAVPTNSKDWGEPPKDVDWCQQPAMQLEHEAMAGAPPVRSARPIQIRPLTGHCAPLPPPRSILQNQGKTWVLPVLPLMTLLHGMKKWGNKKWKNHETLLCMCMWTTPRT